MRNLLYIIKDLIFVIPKEMPIFMFFWSLIFGHFEALIITMSSGGFLLFHSIVLVIQILWFIASCIILYQKDVERRNKKDVELRNKKYEN